MGLGEGDALVLAVDALARNVRAWVSMPKWSLPDSWRGRSLAMRVWLALWSGSSGFSCGILKFWPRALAGLRRIGS